MLSVRIITQLQDLGVPTAIALGNFDGIHRGHRRVIDPILEIAELFSGRYSTVVSFDPHPRFFFSGQPQPLLTPIAEKARVLADLGLDQLVLLPFTRAIADLSPEEFVVDVLIHQLGAEHLCVGADFRFGRNRSGAASDLRRIAESFGVPTEIIPLFNDDGERISSSAIRRALGSGDVARAAELLGRPYALCGRVVGGQRLGRTLGFPTANLDLPADKLLPAQGVYAGRVSSDGLGLDRHPAVMNLGLRPTVSGDRQLQAEVHLLDWQGDCYGADLRMELLAHLRSEQRFASLDDLKAQIGRDCAQARDLLGLAIAR